MNRLKHLIEGVAAPLPIANLDTDQIMPKQFLRGIDKAGLAKGVLYDLRFDLDGKVRPDFVLNRPEYADASILVSGANFGCGSSREHAVWGLLQAGIRAVIAPSFGEIFYSNAMNNGLMLVALPERDVEALLAELATAPAPVQVRVDVDRLSVDSPTVSAPFALGDLHRDMFLSGLDMLGASLRYKDQIEAFASRWHGTHPWLRDVASLACARIAGDRPY
jgi:3-isopropylmalate/(R)-2-methylmalate dehydratase small subunit